MKECGISYLAARYKYILIHTFFRFSIPVTANKCKARSHRKGNSQFVVANKVNRSFKKQGISKLYTYFRWLKIKLIHFPRNANLYLTFQLCISVSSFVFLLWRLKIHAWFSKSIDIDKFDKCNFNFVFTLLSVHVLYTYVLQYIIIIIL